MNAKVNQFVGRVFFSILKRSFQLGVIIVLSVIISSVIVDIREDEITSEIWKAFDIHNQIEQEKLKENYGIIDDEMIDISDNQPFVNI